MPHRRIRALVITAVIAGIICVIAWNGYRAYRRAQFVRDLHLVLFSTSLIGEPYPEQERAAQDRAKALGIDLLAAYKNNLESDARVQLAWMLVTNESSDYCEFARKNIRSVPWAEVRIWIVRRGKESLSPGYRAKLLDLVLLSPTSEGRLAAGRWYRAQGRTGDSEDAFHAAMTDGQYWDALDAADELLQSERYHADAVKHLFAVVRDPERFMARAARSLLDVYGVRAELEPLVKSCGGEGKGGPNWKKLVERLERLAATEVSTSRPYPGGR